ncbi:MAG: phosphodiesterase [Burkholderiaceae bacterium]
MLIAQLSDIHCRPAGQLYKDVANSNRSLVRAIDHLHQLDTRPDLVLLTGDLTDYGQPDEYEAAREILSGLEIPLYLMPGNHDDPDHFRAAFSGHDYLPSSGPVNYCIDHLPVRIVALDSCIAGAHHGNLTPETLDYLRYQLESAPDKPTIIALHHPPFVCGIPYMDQYRYQQSDPLAAVLTEFSNVEAVVCGHVHRFMMRRWAGTVVCTCPSTATEIALQLNPQALPQTFLGPPGVLLHWWSAQDGLVSHLSSIGEFPGPYPFC